MKNCIIFLSLSFLLLSGAVMAQKDDSTYISSPVDEGNLVNNGDFENYSGKLSKPGKFYLLDYWDVLTSGRADLFEAGNALKSIGIPDNIYGEQEAYSGQRYAGINAFSYDPKNGRSYLFTELNAPLQKGQLYCVKYVVNLADRSRFAIANLGAYFSESKLENDGGGNVFFEAQINNGKRYIQWDNNYADESWGPKFDGQDYVPWYAWWPDSPYYGQTAKWEARPDNIKNFYDTGVTLKNSVSVGGGNDMFSARVTYTNLNQSGITPFTKLTKNWINEKF